VASLSYDRSSSDPSAALTQADRSHTGKPSKLDHCRKRITVDGVLGEGRSKDVEQLYVGGRAVGAEVRVKTVAHLI
jgi:hypothetical protein